MLGCASTRVTSDDPNAEIYFNDNYLGVGEARIDRVGPPRTSTLEAKKGGKTVGRQTISRSFTFMTVVWGVCSYYTGLYWGWYYPETVRIPVIYKAEISAQEIKSLWMEPRESVWMKPLK